MFSFGGADSDICVDILSRADTEKKAKYVWFNTGIEYDATKRHLDYLEAKYNINIERKTTQKPVPLCCKEYGQPFLNKIVSAHLERAQSFNFEYDYNLNIDELCDKYPNAPSYILKWWANAYSFKSYNVGRYKGLKEFLSQNPPKFRISSRCCEYAKKKVAKDIYNELKVDCDILGVRQAEGGARSNNTTCTTVDKKGVTKFRPIFWFTNADKAEYNYLFDIQNSEAYTKYGLKRTGCAGCPFNKNCLLDIEKIKEYEPKLYQAAQSVFKDSYQYTAEFEEFRKALKGAEPSKGEK